MQTTTSFNTDTLCIIPTAYLYLLYASQNKQRGVFPPIQRLVFGFYNRYEKCLLRGMDRVFKNDGLRFVFKV